MKTIHELTPDEMQELKDNYFMEVMSDEIIDDKIMSPGDVTDEMIHSIYRGVSFVKEDFFCNINNHE